MAEKLIATNCSLVSNYHNNNRCEKFKVFKHANTNVISLKFKTEMKFIIYIKCKCQVIQEKKKTERERKREETVFQIMKMTFKKN